MSLVSSTSFQIPSHPQQLHQLQQDANGSLYLLPPNNSGSSNNSSPLNNGSCLSTSVLRGPTLNGLPFAPPPPPLVEQGDGELNRQSYQNALNLAGNILFAEHHQFLPLVQSTAPTTLNRA